MAVVARAYAEADGQTRVALIARHGREIVAVAGYERFAIRRRRRSSFAIAEPFQRRGLGTRMLEQLAEHAAALGLERFQADVLAVNSLMLRVFGEAGFAVRREHGGDEVESGARHPPERPAGGADRAARPCRQRRVAARVAGAAIGRGRRRLRSPRECGWAGAAQHHRGRLCGVVWAVNRSGGVVCSARAARELAELPEAPELAVIAVPAVEVVGVVEDAARVGARAVLVISAGFADAGGDGRSCSASCWTSCARTACGWSVRTRWGSPTAPRMCACTRRWGRCRPPPGGLAISSQSGALGLALLGQAEARGLGVAAFLPSATAPTCPPTTCSSTGRTTTRSPRSACMSSRSATRGASRDIAQRVSRRKPILVVKGQLARPLRAGPQTGSHHRRRAAQRGRLRRALSRRRRAARDSTDELFDVAELFERQPLPAGRNVGDREQLGRAGDAGRRRLALARVARAAAERDHAEAPEGRVAARDPRRQPGRSDRRRRARRLRHGRPRAAGARPAIDAVVVLFIPLAENDPELVLDAVEQAADRAQKPVARRHPGRRRPAAASSPPGAYRTSACPRRARSRWAAPPTAAPGSRARSASPLGCPASSPNAHASWSPRRSPAPATATAGSTPRRSRRCWTPTAFRARPPRAAATADAAVAAAAGVGGPIALKASLPGPYHAGDIDAVLLGLTGEDAIRAGWQELRRRVSATAYPWRNEVVVQPLLDGGADILVGSITDPDLGPLLGLGVGGRRPALTHAITFRLAPATDAAGRGPDRRLDRRRGLAGGLRRHPATGPPRPARPHPALRAPAHRHARARRSRPQPGPRAARRLPRPRRPPAPHCTPAPGPNPNLVGD